MSRAAMCCLLPRTYRERLHLMRAHLLCPLVNGPALSVQGIKEGDLMLKEDRELGQIGKKVYLYYGKAYGWVLFAPLP